MLQKPYRTFLLLGGNLGDVKQTLTECRKLLEESFGKLQEASAYYQSPPWGFEHDSPFINQVLVFGTYLAPIQQLECCLEIEAELGRVRSSGEGYQARTVDIDILFIDDLCLNKEQLVVPHPRVHLRRFALMPLLEVAPHYVHPQMKQTVLELFEHCVDDATITKVD